MSDLSIDIRIPNDVNHFGCTCTSTILDKELISDVRSGSVIISIKNDITKRVLVQCSLLLLELAS
jgi:hypothetical protein